MAKFKIYLLNLRSSDTYFTPQYSILPVSEFNTEYDENISYGTTNITAQKHYTATLKQTQTINYTYNEKFEKHQNTQRTLSFSMNRNVIRVDRIEKNPFINYMFVGAQLLLVDKYDKHHLMTISKISYEFKEQNTIFNYECQDSFNYQLSRQNNGYEITNDVSSASFIGAQSLDWWVLCKIHPDCKISYSYKKLQDVVKISNDYGNVDIIKSAYLRNEYPELYKTVPFAASGTASSVLIALGELYGLQLQVYERLDFTTGVLTKYYWFEPSKSLRPTGLKYSPYLDLQSFSLSHNGQSFSSILNIQNHTIGDEIITALPSVPNFFRQWFETSEWENTEYHAGLFSSACQSTTDVTEWNLVEIVHWEEDGQNKTEKFIRYYNEQQCFYYEDEHDNKWVYIPLTANFSSQYDYISFTPGADTYSTLTLVGINPHTYCSKFGDWKVVGLFELATSEVNTDGNYVPVYKTYELELIANHTPIPIWVKNATLKYLFLTLDSSNDAQVSTIDGILYFSQVRDASEEELEFAAIADQLPWLENKLVNFNYFYEHSIITMPEYNKLMHILENDLRKVNAKLLLYSQLYYQSMQQRTKVISMLSSKLDKIGAVFQSDFIRPFQSAGRITETTEFSLALDDLVNNSANTAQLTDNYWYMQNETNQWSDLKSCQGQLISFINYYETLTDYVNYYINSEQTFLKNMYLFREYFETNANLNKIHMYTFTLPDQYNNSKLIAFNNPNHYVKLTEENIHYTIYEKKDDLYIPYNPDQIVSKSNATDFYYLNTSEATMSLVSSDSNTNTMSSYSKDQQYYEQQWIVTIADGYTWPVDDNGKPHRFVYGTQIDENGDNSGNKFEFELITSSKIQMRCYRHCLHTVNINTTPTTVLKIQFDSSETITNVTVNQQIYELVNLGDIRINYFYQTITGQKLTRLADFYIHRRITSPWKAISNDATNADWALSFNDLGLSWVALKPLINSKNWSSSRIGNGKDDENDNVYKECFPLTSLYWYGRKANNKGELDEKDDYHSVPFVNIENCAQFYRRIAVSLEEYKNWQLGLSITGGGMLSSDIPFVRIVTTGNLIAPLVWGICNAVWNNRSTTFGNSGWTYHDVFDCSHDEFQGWSNSTRLLYTKSAEGYNLTNKTSVFPGEAFNIQDRTWTESDDQKHQIVNYNWGYHEATNLLFTYYSFNYRLPVDVANKYHYQPSYWRILNPDDVIAKTDKIGMILTSRDSNPLFIQKGVPDTLNFVDLKLETVGLTVSSGINTINRLNSVVYYPLRNYIASIGGADFHWSVNSSQASLSDLLLNSSMSGVWDDYRLVDNDKGAVAIFVREESWSYEELPQNPGQLTVDDIVTYSNSVYYDNDTMQPINLIELCPDMADDFYVTGRITTDYTKISNNFVLSNELQYYTKVGNTFERRYTRQQLIDQDNMYVKLSDTYSYQSFLDTSEVSTICYIYNKVMQDGKVNYVLDTTESCKIYKDTSGWKIRSTSITDPLPISVQYQYYDLSTYTNGLFWYVYKDSDINLLMEKALLIETNLTEYWTNAYYASKNCKYFLPEYWQPVVDNQNNYFSSSILSVNHIRHEYDTEIIDNIYADDLVRESKFYRITDSTSVGQSCTTYTIETKLTDLNTVTVNYRLDTTDGNATLVDDNNSTGTLSSDTGTSISIEYTNTLENDDRVEGVQTNSGYNSLKLTLDNRGNLTITDNYHVRKWNTKAVDIHDKPFTLGEAAYDGSLELTITYHQKPVDVVNQINLSNIYIPQVKKTPQSAYYKLRHSNIADSTTSTIARTYHLQTDQYDTLPWLANNFDYIKNVSDYLQLNITEWLVHRIDVGNPHTYYEPVNGGTTWSEILNTLSRGAFVESQFGGWYDMMVWTLQSGTYNNYDPVQYRQAQEEHNRIWTEIYTKYPNIIYEQSYTNESATSSSELLQLAQYAFRDYTQVENNYNITVIDPNTLKGYRGQELHIGDGIELDAQELYDDQDSDIYRSLIQYLYITDISYDLRRDDNIQLTVNSIKYQDKVIGQLIKLIR